MKKQDGTSGESGKVKAENSWEGRWSGYRFIKSNVWSDQDCRRDDCLICSSAGPKEKKGKCKKRNILYETYCITCWKRENGEKEKIELERFQLELEAERNNVQISSKVEELNEKKRKKKDNGRKTQEKIEINYKIKYVGESARSEYDRGKEHAESFKNLHETSHLLKH